MTNWTYVYLTYKRNNVRLEIALTKYVLHERYYEESVVSIVEAWENLDALHKHLKMPLYEHY